MEYLGWFIALFGCVCLFFGVLIGYKWGYHDGYRSGLQAGDGACEARHSGKLGDK